MKICTECRIKKPFNNFSKHKLGSFGLRPKCKPCIKQESLLYSRTIKGWVSAIYNKQKTSSVKRGMLPPTYSKKWLFELCDNSSVFHILFQLWVESGHVKSLRPSINRLKDNLGYTPSNIEIVTWEENQLKAYKMIRDGGVRGSPNTPVNQYSLDGELLATYVSFSSAQRVTGVNATHIGQACAFKWGHNRAKGYLWKKV